MRAKRDLTHCALLLAIPVTEEDFYRVMRGGLLVDYAAGPLRGESADSVWNSRYRNIVRVAQGLIQTARALGVKVYTQVGLREVAEATTHCDTVILIAHWRGASVHAEELRGHYKELVEVWSYNRKHPVISMLGGIPPDVEGLAERLNRSIASGDLLSCLPEAIAAAGRKSITLGQTVSRDLLDEVFAGVLPPGNRIEFYDGQHTPSEFEQSICQGFEGEIDLAICNSQAIAVILDLRRRDKIHHLHWPDLVDPLPQFLLIGDALLHMANTSDSYVRSRLLVEHLL